MKIRQEVYDTYWRFAAERQEIFFKKFEGRKPSYTSDPILQTYKFCNVYRASDKVSQFLIRDIIYKQRKLSAPDILFRIFLFRLLNKIETWKFLEEKLGKINLKNFSPKTYSKALKDIKKLMPIYGNAFILCANKAFGFDKKHDNYLALLEKVFIKEKTDKKLIKSKNLKQLFETLKELPLIGTFMAYQLAIDFNYSEVFDFSENDFTIAGLGALRGIRKCFINTGRKDDSYVIQFMVGNQKREFRRLGIKFKTLWGRPLQAIDCEGLFCEVDKYSRVKFPELRSSRVRIKTTYKPTKEKISYFYPPKWGINGKIKY